MEFLSAARGPADIPTPLGPIVPVRTSTVVVTVTEAEHADDALETDSAKRAMSADEATTLSPESCEEGEILRKDVDA